MAQTLEKIYREKLTLLPKPECEVKGRRTSEGISQHPGVQCQVELKFKVPTEPLGASVFAEGHMASETSFSGVI